MCTIPTRFCTKYALWVNSIYICAGSCGPKSERLVAYADCWACIAWVSKAAEKLVPKERPNPRFLSGQARTSAKWARGDTPMKSRRRRDVSGKCAAIPLTDDTDKLCPYWKVDSIPLSMAVNPQPAWRRLLDRRSICRRPVLCLVMRCALDL
jgi:hypothetical protein